jgi:hypothetical protein
MLLPATILLLLLLLRRRLVPAVTEVPCRPAAAVMCQWGTPCTARPLLLLLAADRPAS